MNIRKVLTKDVITLNLNGTTKEAVIDNLIDVLFLAGKIQEKEKVRQAILERESRMSTGIQAGIAIPHGKCETVNELVACVGICREGIDFDALDHEPSRIFIMTVSPVDRTGPHVQFLAEVSRLLKEAPVREEILKCTDPEQVLQILAG